MADSKISDLTAGTVAAADDFAFVQSGTTKTDTVQGILDLVPASSDTNLGDTNLTADANRTYTLNGSLSTDSLIFKTGGGTSILSLRGDDTVYMPAGNMSIGTTPNATIKLKLQSDAYGVYSTSMTLADYYASSAASKNFHAENSKVGGQGIYANMTAASGVSTGIYGRAIASSSGTNVGIRADAKNGAINHAFFIDGGNIHLDDTTNGCKIGTTTSQKIGFWNTTPIVQPTTAYTAATFAANTSGIADDTATWDSYTIGSIVGALRGMGILA